MRKPVKHKKPVATLPYLVPPTNAEIDKLEFEIARREEMENPTYPFRHSFSFFERIEDWLWDINLYFYELIILGLYTDREKILNPRNIYQPQPDQGDDSHLLLCDNLYPHENKNKENLYPHHWFDGLYARDDGDVDIFFDYHGNHEEELMKSLTLFGLKYTERQQLLLEHRMR